MQSTIIPDRTGRINIAYITSEREIGDDERVGRQVKDEVDGTDYGYRMGNLESLAIDLAEGKSEFSKVFNLRAIITDDSDTQHDRAWKDTDLWPRDLQVPIRDDRHDTIYTRSLEDMTYRVPSSTWRKVRTKVDGIRHPNLVQLKADRKAEYEREIIELMREKDIDILVSDSYLSIVGPTLMSAYGPQEEGGIGSIVNIHPAITDKDSPYRLPGLTPTRDAFTRARYGKIIIDDKHRVDVPEGEPHDWEFPEGSGKIREAVDVPAYNVTGATVHVIDKEVDNGQVIIDKSYEFNPKTMTPEAIRTRNYDIKRELLPDALLAYVARQDVQDMILQRRPILKVINA